MLTKAGDALEAAFQKWNNKRHWNVLRDTTTVITVAPFDVVSCTTTSGSTTVTSASLQGVLAGDLVSGTGIRPEAYVVSIDTTPSPDTMELSHAASASGTVTLTFSRRDYAVPTNFKYVYNVRIPSHSLTLRPVHSRLYDALDPDQSNVDMPLWYDLYPLGATGKIRFHPTPNAEYSVVIKYNRRLTVPSVDGTALDIPIDWEWGLLAEAKSLFLTDKVGYETQAGKWDQVAAVALNDAVRADAKHPDMDEGFLPGYLNRGVSSSPGSIIDDFRWGFD